MARKQSTHKHNYQRLLNNIYESIKEKEFFLKKQNTLLGQNSMSSIPRSLPKLLDKECDLLTSANFCKEFLGKEMYDGYKYEGRSKQSTLQRTAFKTVDDDQKQVSRDNMQLLGLNIQRVNYSTKGKIQMLDETVTVVNGCHLETEANDRPILYHRVSTRNRIRSTKQPIRIEPKTSREKSAAIPKQREYHNPVYDNRINSYREMLFEVNYTYRVYRSMERCEEWRNEQRYRAWVGYGNNGSLIKGLLKRRFWWVIQEQKSINCNFMWTQLKCNEYFGRQRQCTVANEQYSRRSSSKKNALSKIMNEEEALQYDKHSKRKDYPQRAQSLRLKQEQSEDMRVHNHLTNNFLLGNKKALFYNLKQYYELSNGNLFKSIPLTFHIKKGVKDPQYKRFVAYYKKRAAYIRRVEKEEEKSVRMRNIWIVKPGELTNRGNGITVIDQVYELDAIMRGEGRHENGQDKTFIVQLYIDRPMLYRKRKFDIRHYMLLTHIHGVFKAYWYAEGYIRTSSFDFDLQNFEREVHLTNDAVQKYTPMYGKYEPANKLSYAQFQRYLDGTYPKMKYSFKGQILPRMKEIALDAVRSAFLTISPERLEHNFQIFGLDFMIDCQFKPWLIEINTNPCLELSCSLLSRIIPQMVDQSLRLTLDALYPPPCHYPNTAKHLVPDASLDNLKYELFFDERVDGGHLRELYGRQKGNIMDEIGDISDDEVYEDEGKDIVLDELL